MTSNDITRWAVVRWIEDQELAGMLRPNTQSSMQFCDFLTELRSSHFYVFEECTKFLKTAMSCHVMSCLWTSRCFEMFQDVPRHGYMKWILAFWQKAQKAQTKTSSDSFNVSNYENDCGMTAAWLDTRRDSLLQCCCLLLSGIMMYYVDMCRHRSSPTNISRSKQVLSITRSSWFRHADCWFLTHRKVFSHDRLSVSSLCSRPADPSANTLARCGPWKNVSHAKQEPNPQLSATWPSRKSDALLLVVDGNIPGGQWPVVGSLAALCQMDWMSMNAA